jgi:hypothetical protein
MEELSAIRHEPIVQDHFLRDHDVGVLQYSHDVNYLVLYSDVAPFVVQAFPVCWQAYIHQPARIWSN